MKFTHKVFHLEEAVERQQYVNNINAYLKPHSVELDTKTIKISNQEEFIENILENKDFVLDFNGYNLDSIQGWRYGEIGLWLSNFLAWKKFLDSDADCGIFMEDDIVFKENFIDLLKQYLLEIPNNWDAFFFAVPEGQFHKYNVHGIDIGLKNICRVYQDHWMLCYVLSKNGASKAINSAKSGVSLPVDWHFFRQKHLFNSYSIKPTSEFGCFGSPTETTFQTQPRKIMTIDS